jgi:spermidine synthase
MIPWIHLDRATVPDNGGELKLMQRGSEFSIRAGNIELMNSRLNGSEHALAEVAAERVGGRKHCRILIGGFGMGFTLRAALAKLKPDAEVTVAELVPEVIAWAKGPMAELSAACLADPRVIVRETDVRNVIAERANYYDAILLDVDNGPEGLTRRANDRIYDHAGLKSAKRALTQGGVLGVWSSVGNPEFVRRLQQTGFRVDEKKVRANGQRRGAHYVIWFGTPSSRA